MRVLYQRCCALDVHKASIAACALITQSDGTVQEQIRRFGTMTRDLLELVAWLREHEIQHVAMESTGVYWKPVWNILEPEGFDLLLANAQMVKAVPGRQTDQKDCQWLADLHRHGLLPRSFVPPPAIRQLRDLTRSRAKLAQMLSSTCNRIEKVLEDANIKLGVVASDVLGASGWCMLRAMVRGESDPQVLADLAKGRLREKIPQLCAALDGRVSPHHRFLLDLYLQQVEFLEEQMQELEAEIARRMQPTAEELTQAREAMAGGPSGATAASTTSPTLPLSAREEAMELWRELPGVGRTTASSLVAELGVDMGQFPTAGHLASWAALCPGNNESAGKRRSGKTRKGNVWLRRTLSEAAWAAAHKKNSYFRAQFGRLAARRGKKRASLAVAHSLLVVAYHLLKHKKHYQELGADFFDHLHKDQLTRQLVRRLGKLGYQVTLQQAAAA